MLIFERLGTYCLVIFTYVLQVLVKIAFSLAWILCQPFLAPVPPVSRSQDQLMQYDVRFLNHLLPWERPFCLLCDGYDRFRFHATRGLG